MRIMGMGFPAHKHLKYHRFAETQSALALNGFTGGVLVSRLLKRGIAPQLAVKRLTRGCRSAVRFALPRCKWASMDGAQAISARPIKRYSREPL